MDYLNIEEILYLHFRAIEDYGGSHGVRDEGRLKSLVDAPRQEVFGVEQYTDVFEKAAVYMRNVIGDHPFTDGNKRTGTLLGGIFLMRNGLSLAATPKELEDFAVQIAIEHLDIPPIALAQSPHRIAVNSPSVKGLTFYRWVFTTLRF